MEDILNQYAVAQRLRAGKLQALLAELPSVHTLVTGISNDIESLAQFVDEMDRLDEDAVELIGHELVRSIRKISDYYGSARSSAVQWVEALSVLAPEED